MASIGKLCTKKGLQFYIRLSPREDIRRPKIYPSISTAGDSEKKIKKAEHEAETVRGYIEDLIDHKSDGRIKIETELWLGGIGSTLRGRLEKVGIVKPKAPDPAETRQGWLVAAWVADYIAKRPDVKSGTKRKWRDVESKLAAFFRTDTIEGVTVQQAKNFRIYLQTTAGNKKAGLSENTLRRHIGIARQFFNAAIDAEIIAKNPFRGQRVSVQANDSRFFYVSPETAQTVLQACPDAEWRLIFGLARFGGLRCPSEVLDLKWQDIDFDRQRFTVHAVKTEHHKDKGVRVVPMFPELRPLFQDAFDDAEPGAVYCIEGYRGKEVNLRTQLGRILKKAGIEPWPKLFQNCRSTRETELFKKTGGNVKAVCSWLGNSPAVALTHYAQVTEADMKEATKNTLLNQAENSVNTDGQNKGHNEGHNQPETVGNSGNTENGNYENSDVSTENQAYCNENAVFIGSQPMGETGLEPVTSRV
jgi:integrase